MDRGSMGVWLLWFCLSRSQQDGLTFVDVAVLFAWEECGLLERLRDAGPAM